MSATSCERCGAPLDVRDAVTDSGWRQAPRLRDLTEVTFGSSVLQIDGTVVPVADVNLGEGDSVFFEHHVMLWKDENVFMSVMTAPGGMKRLLGDLPFVLSVARGPGRVSFSRDSPGELVVKPIDPGIELDVREHAMVVATAGLTYSFEKLGGGMKATLTAGTGMYLDRFTAGDTPGLVVLHGYGNVFERTLGEGETIQVEPGGFLYKDSAVGVETVTHKLAPENASSAVQGAKSVATRGLAGLRGLKALKDKGIGGLMSGEVLQTASGMFTGPGITLMRLTGPGRVGIQSMYMEHGAA
ncbi:MAG TPA: AIM24 family protein [Mycobacteriales bacterium]|nr:AIM24 family protein [Mycobacteriales bacterium]